MPDLLIFDGGSNARGVQWVREGVRSPLVVDEQLRRLTVAGETVRRPTVVDEGLE